MCEWSKVVGSVYYDTVMKSFRQVTSMMDVVKCERWPEASEQCLGKSSGCQKRKVANIKILEKNNS